jgi:hypothetical protein
MADGPRDQFVRYFAEKLWALVPAHYREQDGLAEPPGVLRAFIEVLAESAAELRRSADRLWEDQFIELCDDWAVPYLGDLVATRLVSALNPRGRRVDVAKTIYYRRRKGTLRVLEELIHDIAHWEGTVVEQFRRLGRARHRLDPPPGLLAGRMTGTSPGGWADLRCVRGAELRGGPFDEFHYTPDVRRHRGAVGRHGIPKLAFHLYCLPVHEVHNVTSRAMTSCPGAFTVDPSGRDIALFVRGERASDMGKDWNQWHAAREWELPAPMPRRLLAHAEYLIQEQHLQNLEQSGIIGSDTREALRMFRDVRFPSERRLRDALCGLPVGPADDTLLAALLRATLVEDCGSAALLPGSLRIERAAGQVVPREQIAAGNLTGLPGTVPHGIPSGKTVVVDPEQGRLLFVADQLPDAPAVTYWQGFSAPIGAGGYDRRRDLPPATASVAGGAQIKPDAEGVFQVEDSATYASVSDVLGVRDLTVQAANLERPYLRLGHHWQLDTETETESTLILEGLWIGVSKNFSVLLRGDYERVTIRHCTLDPGGTDAEGSPIAPVSLIVEGKVKELVVACSILGPIRVSGSGSVTMLRVSDAIVQSAGDDADAIWLPSSRVELNRVTVLGTVAVEWLDASEALITGLAEVVNSQQGCFRFGAVRTGSRVPHPYESHFLSEADRLFTSRRFGHYGYAQLNGAAPELVRRGAENGSEIGAFGGQMNPIRLDGLRAKVDEYAPFGTIPIWIPET